MRAGARNNHHHSKQVLAEQIVPQLAFVPLGHILTGAIGHARLPIEDPGVKEVFPRHFSLQSFEHTVGACQVALQILWTEIVNSKIDLAIEFLDTSIPCEQT